MRFCFVSTLALFFIFFAIGFLITYLGTNKPLLEGYGGPIKVVKRIPKNNCYNICQQHYTRCMQMNRYSEGAAFACGRARDNCISTCNYSNFLRM